jgi:hypothetical protein
VGFVSKRDWRDELERYHRERVAEEFERAVRRRAKEMIAARETRDRAGERGGGGGRRRGVGRVHLEVGDGDEDDGFWGERGGARETAA